MVLCMSVQLLHQQGEKPVPRMQQNCFEEHPNGGQSLSGRSKKSVQHPLSLSLILAAQLESFEEKMCLTEHIYAAPWLSARLTEPTKSKPRWCKHQLREAGFGQHLGFLLYRMLSKLAETQHASRPSDTTLSTGRRRDEKES